jgi:hypothetical protein
VPTHHVSESTIIAAPPARVYAILADYRVGHPGILPQPPFHSYELESGGQGAGTIVCFKMTAMGRTQSFRAAVTEPEPGRVLVESYFDTRMATTFTVDPHGDGAQSRVTFATDFETRGGPLGVLERFFVSRFLKKTYRREQQNLARAAAAMP